VVIDPSAVWGLQQRVVQQEGEPASRSKHPRDLGDCAIDVIDVLEHQTGQSSIERCISEWKCCCTGLHVLRPSPALASHCDLIRRRVSADNGATCGSERPSDLTVTRSDVEHALGASQL
jgi:hypothetical protein